MLSSVRPGSRFLGAITFAIGMLVAFPALSQATTTSPPGISAAGTVPGTYNGNPVTVQVASVQSCIPGTSTFVAMWPGGSFAEAANSQSDSCTNYDASGRPQSLSFSGAGKSGGSSVGGNFQGPGSPTNPFTIGFTITTAGGTLNVPQHAPGPLQGAPGRVQPFISSTTHTTSRTCGQGEECTTDLSSPDSNLFVDSNPNSDPNQNAGTQTESVDLGTPLSCVPEQYGSYSGFDPHWFGWHITGTADKVLTYDLFSLPFNADRNVEFCFGATDRFQAASDDGASQPGTLPDGTPGFIGLLRTCDQVDGPQPCIIGVGPISGGLEEGPSGTEVQISIPQGFGADPFGHI
jgi:hypothetical protein